MASEDYDVFRRYSPARPSFLLFAYAHHLHSILAKLLNHLFSGGSFHCTGGFFAGCCVFGVGCRIGRVRADGHQGNQQGARRAEQYVISAGEVVVGQ